MSKRNPYKKEQSCEGINIVTTAYTLKDAMSIKETQNTKVPDFDTGRVKQLLPGYHCWDSDLAFDTDGNIADIDGYNVLWALCRPEGAGFSSSNKIAYFYTKDGVHYTFGGFLFETAIYDGISEWSGSLRYRDDGKLQMFYTVADGYEAYGNWQTRQRFAVSIHPVSTDETTLKIEAPIHHELLHGASEPDGIIYETPDQAAKREALNPTRHLVLAGSDQTENNCDRDSFVYRNKRDGQDYVVFEGNTGPGAGYAPGIVRDDYLGRGMALEGVAITEDMLKANGCVGIIKLTNEDGTFGVRKKPWLVTNLVTDEIERITVFDYDGHVYLFVDCHGNKMTTNASNPDMVNRDFMLGFRAPYFGGPLTPLNGNGVVLQQKSGGAAYAGQNENQQYLYSFGINPTAEAKESGIFKCVTYAGWSNAADGSGLKQIMSSGPSLFIKINGLCTEIVDMKHDILPA